jgi:erythromycin esterase-like protein
MPSRLHDLAQPVDDLLDLVGDARIVLLGEASHGTHEFYAHRADLTERLITERGFGGLALEADWPPVARVCRYVRCVSDDPDAEAALADFRRFPRWMWRNDVFAGLVERLRGTDAGVYGLDLYSLHDSMEEVVAYLDRVDPQAAQRARRRYGCFDHFNEHEYGYATATRQKDPCEDAVVAQLMELRERAAELSGQDGSLPRDAHFYAVQNARLAANAEEYYRETYRGRTNTWNLRDRHMGDTLDALLDHVEGGVVVWAHNSHLGDARATGMFDRGELNLGQLARERHGQDDVRIVGFTTHSGTVTAARDWDGPAEMRIVRPGLQGSVERLLHDARIDEGLLDLHGEAGRMLSGEHLQRMIGVIYRPETERMSHYVPARPAEQFDALVHVDVTHALRPLELWAAEEREPAEMFPTGY